MVLCLGWGSPTDASITTRARKSIAKAILVELQPGRWSVHFRPIIPIGPLCLVPSWSYRIPATGRLITIPINDESCKIHGIIHKDPSTRRITFNSAAFKSKTFTPTNKTHRQCPEWPTVLSGGPNCCLSAIIMSAMDVSCWHGVVCEQDEPLPIRYCTYIQVERRLPTLVRCGLLRVATPAIL